MPIDPEEVRVRADLPAPGDAPPGRVGVAEAHFPMRSWAREALATCHDRDAVERRLGGAG